jgi:FtsH-binding integral membrane protein
MNVTKDEAQLSLETIERIQRHTRRVLAHSGAPFYLIIWGVIWLFGYLGSQFLDEHTAGMAWMTLDVIGVVASVFVGWWMSRQMRRPGRDARIGLFWLTWLVYGVLIVWLTGVYADLSLLGLFLAVFAMFGYVVMGLWLWRPLLWVGVGITILAIAAYLLLPNFLDLAMAILGGGTLIVSGLYIYRNWR